MKGIGLIFSLLGILAFSLPEKKKIKIFIAGDSTASIKETKAFPETGWGMPFIYFWDSTVKIVNKARNGRSTQSFRNEGLWQQILDESADGDYVLIQFGHNDEVPTKANATTEATFGNNLKVFVSEARSKKLNSVLLTPAARRKFDSTGKIVGTHDVYSQIVRDVASNENIPLIDMDKKSQQLYQQMGVEHSKLLFLQLKPGEHPNYPDGKDDNTHFNELGARLIAQLVLMEIKKLIPDLTNRVVSPVMK
jgi:lysophospholipase L1-like esterase